MQKGGEDGQETEQSEEMASPLISHHFHHILTTLILSFDLVSSDSALALE